MTFYQEAENILNKNKSGLTDFIYRLREALAPKHRVLEPNSIHTSIMKLEALWVSWCLRNSSYVPIRRPRNLKVNN